MKTITSVDDLKRLRDEIIEKKRRDAQRGHIQIFINMGSCSIAAGALETLKAVKDQVDSLDLKDISIIETGCLGLCAHEPIVEVAVGEEPRVTYRSVTPDVAQRIVRDHVAGGEIVSDFVIESLPYPTI